MTGAKDTQKKSLGRNQWIAVGSLAVLFITSTLFVVAPWLSRGSVSVDVMRWWGDFNGGLVPWILGISLGGSALIKSMNLALPAAMEALAKRK